MVLRGLPVVHAQDFKIKNEQQNETTTRTTVIKTELGHVTNNTWPTEDVGWVIADWGEERALVSVNAAGAADKLRLKISSHGSWVPLYPSDIVDMGSEQRIPAAVSLGR